MIACSRSLLTCWHNGSTRSATATSQLAVRRPYSSLSLRPLRIPSYYLGKLQALAKHAQPSAHPSEPTLSAALSKVLKALELLSLATSVGLQGCALAMASKQDAHTAEVHEDETYHAEAMAPPMQHTWKSPTWLSHFAIVALILTYVLGVLHRTCHDGR